MVHELILRFFFLLPGNNPLESEKGKCFKYTILFPPQVQWHNLKFLKMKRKKSWVVLGHNFVLFVYLSLSIPPFFANPFPRIGSHFNRGNTTTPACGILIRQSEEDPCEALWAWNFAAQGGIFFLVAWVKWVLIAQDATPRRF